MFGRLFAVVFVFASVEIRAHEGVDTNVVTIPSELCGNNAGDNAIIDVAVARALEIEAELGAATRRLEAGKYYYAGSLVLGTHSAPHSISVIGAGNSTHLIGVNQTGPVLTIAGDAVYRDFQIYGDNTGTDTTHSGLYVDGGPVRVENMVST